jgi:hypothetical protein
MNRLELRRHLIGPFSSIDDVKTAWHLLSTMGERVQLFKHLVGSSHNVVWSNLTRFKYHHDIHTWSTTLAGTDKNDWLMPTMSLTELKQTIENGVNGEKENG